MYVWSHREKLEQVHWDWLAEQQKDGKLCDYAMALCVEMCVAQDKKELAEKFVEDLRAKAQKNAQRPHLLEDGRLLALDGRSVRDHRGGDEGDRRVRQGRPADRRHPRLLRGHQARRPLELAPRTRP